MAPDVLQSLIAKGANVLCPLLFFDLWLLAESCGSKAGKDALLTVLSAFLCIFRYFFIFDPTLLWKNLVKSILEIHIDLGRLVATPL